MALTDIPLDEIQEERLLRLIATQAAESLYIDYKSDTYGGNDDQRREFLADVSSFANASGGDFVIGMTAGYGVHPKVSGGKGYSLFYGLRLRLPALRERVSQASDQSLDPRHARLDSPIGLLCSQLRHRLVPGSMT
jgi:hypothetical protein